MQFNPINLMTASAIFSPGASASQIQSAINSGGVTFLKAGTYTLSSGLNMVTGSKLVGEGSGSTILKGQSGTGNLIQTNSAGTGAASVNLDITVEGVELNQASTEGFHLYCVCTERFHARDILLSGGNSAKESIRVEDSSTVGAFYNDFSAINARANLLTKAMYSQQGFNPGPNWLYGGSYTYGATFGIDVQASMLFVYGAEVIQGTGIVAGSIPVRLAKDANATFNPKLIFTGDFEPGATPTTAISLDANSLASFIGNFSVTASQISVAAGGIITYNNVATTNTQSLQGYAITTPTIGANNADVQNTNPVPVLAYVTGTGTGITAYGITDPAGTLTSFTTTVNVGNAFRVDPFGKIRFTYTGSPTWKWYGL